ncbi:MAG: hypothetical protein R3F49_10885 [Planctomycetota bacterium]
MNAVLEVEAGAALQQELDHVDVTTPYGLVRRGRVRLGALGVVTVGVLAGVERHAHTRGMAELGRERERQVSFARIGLRQESQQLVDPTEREPKSGIGLIVDGTHRVAIERDFDEVTLRRLIEFLAC